MSKWYVHDEADCFGSFETVEEAAAEATSLVANGMEGVHIVYMTEAQAQVYCETGSISKAFKA